MLFLEPDHFRDHLHAEKVKHLRVSEKFRHVDGQGVDEIEVFAAIFQQHGKIFLIACDIMMPQAQKQAPFQETAAVMLQVKAVPLLKIAF